MCYKTFPPTGESTPAWRKHQIAESNNRKNNSEIFNICIYIDSNKFFDAKQIIIVQICVLNSKKNKKKFWSLI